MQGLLTLRPRSSATAQEPKTTVEPFQDLLDAQPTHVARGELDRQRDTFQTTTDVRHQGGGSFGQRERRREGGGALREEPDGGIAQDVARPASWLGIGQRQGRHLPHDLAGNTQRLPAGAQNAHVRTTAQESFGELNAGVDEMLAVVEHEERTAICQRLRECLDRWDVVR